MRSSLAKTSFRGKGASDRSSHPGELARPARPASDVRTFRPQFHEVIPVNDIHFAVASCMHMRSEALTFNTQVSGEQAPVRSAVKTMLPQSVLLVLVLFSSLLWPGSQKEEEPSTAAGSTCNIQPSVHTEAEGE